MLSCLLKNYFFLRNRMCDGQEVWVEKLMRQNIEYKYYRLITTSNHSNNHKLEGTRGTQTLKKSIMQA